jgi:3D-(3,5/4)-trihydroxycyclohexane-1,2-dione acylhydrolase (decyclizing)
VLRVHSIADLRSALATARSSDVTTVIEIETDPLVSAPDSSSWWDVPVAEVSSRDATQRALKTYLSERQQQRTYLRPTDLGTRES